MNKHVVLGASLLVLANAGGAAQAPSGVTEEVEVKLVYVEALVTDGKGATVSGLAKEDFLLTVDGKAREIDVFDANCTEASLAEPEPNKDEWTRPAIPDPPTPRKIVFFFDYNNLPKEQRAGVLDFAGYMLQQGKGATEEVMLVALTDRVRIEQRFTADLRALGAALQRMKYDLTLWARDFGGVSGKTYFENITTLMDVLGQYEGAKAVVMFSQWPGASTTNDLWFRDVAVHSASARAPIYPVDTAGLVVGASPGGPPGLARLANESGGEMTFRTNDLSLGYARAQRAMSCSYGIGYYVKDDEPGKARTVRVRLADRSGLRVRSAEQVAHFDERQTEENRLRAAMVDPGNFENPYIRGHLFPIRPVSKGAWATWIGLHFRMKVDAGGDDLDVLATLDRGPVQVGKYREQFHIDPSSDGSPVPVTIFGDVTLKPGDYRLTMALNRPGADVPQTTVVDLQVPEVPETGLFVRGPVLAKALDEGILIRTGKPDAAGAEVRSTLDEIIGEQGTFQPLLIHQVEPADTLLAYWEVCTLDRKGHDGGTVERRLVNKEGTALELEPVPLALVKGGVRCQRHLDSIEAGKLAEGQYRLEVAVKDAQGQDAALGLAPIRVAAAP